MENPPSWFWSMNLWDIMWKQFMYEHSAMPTSSYLIFFFLHLKKSLVQIEVTNTEF